MAAPLHTPHHFRLLPLFLLLLLLFSSITHSTASPNEAEILADSLFAYRTPDGGILVTSPGHEETRLVPYFANFAALGWTETARVTTDTAKREKYLEAAREWMNWYASHQNPDGTIYDFEGTPDNLHSTGDYDSTDSYPATYAMLMWSYYKATGDEAYLRQKLPSLKAAYNAMFLTIDAFGLTYAKPGFYYRYLMDNCEVAAGLAAFARIFTLLGDTDTAQHAQSSLATLKPQFASMYKPEEQYFGFALDPYGAISGSFSKGYPDAMANLFALTFLAPADSAESAALLSKTKSKFWQRDDARDFPHWWLWAAMVCNDSELQEAALGQLRDQTSSPGAHSYMVGLAAATLSSGLESLRYPEVVCTWQQLTEPTPTRAVPPGDSSLAGPGTSLYITSRNSTATIQGAGWRTLQLSIPAVIPYEITSSTGYLLMNTVFQPPLDLRQADSIQFDFQTPVRSQLQLRPTIIETDGDWWSATVPKTVPGENSVTIPLDRLTSSPWGKGGDRKHGLDSIRGIRIQFDNKADKPVTGTLTIHRLAHQTSTTNSRSNTTHPAAQTKGNNHGR